MSKYFVLSSFLLDNWSPYKAKPIQELIIKNLEKFYYKCTDEEIDKLWETYEDELLEIRRIYKII